MRHLANMRIGFVEVIGIHFELYLCRRRPGIEFRDGIQALERLVAKALALRERQGVECFGPFIKSPMAESVRPAPKLEHPIPRKLFALALLLGANIPAFNLNFFFMLRAIDIKRYVRRAGPLAAVRDRSRTLTLSLRRSGCVLHVYSILPVGSPETTSANLIDLLFDLDRVIPTSTSFPYGATTDIGIERRLIYTGDLVRSAHLDAFPFPGHNLFRPTYHPADAPARPPRSHSRACAVRPLRLTSRPDAACLPFPHFADLWFRRLAV